MPANVWNHPLAARQPPGHTMAILATKQGPFISQAAITHSEYADAYAKARGRPSGEDKTQLAEASAISLRVIKCLPPLPGGEAQSD